ncbi:MAG: hypothetical protein WCR85_00335 [Sphaerochaeta sp.]
MDEHTSFKSIYVMAYAEAIYPRMRTLWITIVGEERGAWAGYSKRLKGSYMSETSEGIKPIWRP